MEKKENKCSFKDHKEIDAVSYCQECKLYMCKDCTIYHKGLFDNHNLLNKDQKIKETFNGYCEKKNHFQKLEYFCKNHNQLCCAACIAKIKNKENGQHTDCNVCTIQDIKNEKKKKLKENLKYLKDLSNNLDQTINNIKKLYEKIMKNKEILQNKIQNTFNKLRNNIDEREKELLLEVDKQYNKLFMNEDIVKKSENLTNKVKISLKIGKTINNEWDDSDKLISIINECIKIENNIKETILINENFKKCNKNKNTKVLFNYDEIYDFYNLIKKFGLVYFNNYKFRQCPENIDDNRHYIVTGENENILTKIGKNNYAGTICEYELDKSKVNKWKIKILNAKYNQIMVGVAPVDFDINTSNHHTCGWYLNCYNLTLYSGPPHKYNGNRTNLSKIEDEILLIMDLKKGTLKFIVNNEDKGNQYTDIPTDKPLFPAVLLYNNNSSVEIIGC